MILRAAGLKTILDNRLVLAIDFAPPFHYHPIKSRRKDQPRQNDRGKMSEIEEFDEQLAEILDAVKRAVQSELPRLKGAERLEVFVNEIFSKMPDEFI